MPNKQHCVTLEKFCLSEDHKSRFFVNFSMFPLQRAKFSSLHDDNGSRFKITLGRPRNNKQIPSLMLYLIDNSFLPLNKIKHVNRVSGVLPKQFIVYDSLLGELSLACSNTNGFLLQELLGRVPFLGALNLSSSQ